MGQHAAIEGGDQSGGHSGAQVAAAGLDVHGLQHVDQAHQGAHHAEGGGHGAGLVIHARTGVVPGAGLLDVVHHDLFGLIGVVVVHDEHDALLEEGVGLLVALLFQGQQAVLPGHLGQLHQLVDDGQGVILLGVHQHREVLGDGGQRADREAGDQDCEGTADDDEDTGRVEEVHDLAGGEESSITALHHTNDHDRKSRDDADDIQDIHSLRSAPFPQRGFFLYQGAFERRRARPGLAGRSGLTPVKYAPASGLSAGPRW